MKPLFQRRSARQTPTIGLVRLPHGAQMALPTYATDGAAGVDLRAAVAADQPLSIPPGDRTLVPTGFVFEIPEGYEGQVRPRSGLALRHGVTCLNTPGTIDSDYRGEIMVLLANLGQEPFSVARGDRIAQMVIAPVVRAAVEERRTAAVSKRGAGGFGSTGTA